MGKFDILVTTVRKLSDGKPFADKTNFYLHNNMAINDIVKNDGIGFTILYSNGNILAVSGDEKVQIIKSKS